MPRIILDFDPPAGEATAEGFTSATEDLVYFLSWAYSARYGASHELTAASMVLKTMGVDLQPLLTFADRNAEDPADEDALERAWQDAEPLAACCRAVVSALRGDPRFAGVLAEYPNLAGNIEELGLIAAAAAERDIRIRVTYELEDEA
ncbi:MAG: hypothetical protein GEU75_07745 [Dehalococcoidia bacterium]|nr:hypothetical protein [Dehalococcoidia bacterium]